VTGAVESAGKTVSLLEFGLHSRVTLGGQIYVLDALFNTDWDSMSTCKHHACQMTANDDGRRT